MNPRLNVIGIQPLKKDQTRVLRPSFCRDADEMPWLNRANGEGCFDKVWP